MPKRNPPSVRSAYLYGRKQRRAPGTPNSARDPRIWGDVAEYVRLGQYVGTKYHRTHVRSDPKLREGIFQYNNVLCSSMWRTGEHTWRTIEHRRPYSRLIVRNANSTQYRYYSQGRISQILSTGQYGCTQYFYRVYIKSAEQLLKRTEIHSSWTRHVHSSTTKS